MLSDLEDTLYRNGLYFENRFKKTKEQELQKQQQIGKTYVKVNHWRINK